MQIYRNSKNDIQVKTGKYSFTCLPSFWDAQEITSGVLNLIFMRNDEIETLLFENVQYILNDSFEK